MKPDQLDELLLRLPSEPPSPGLSRQIRLALRIHQQAHHLHPRTQRLRLSLGAVLGFTGAWFSIPPLWGWYLGLSLPASGLTLSMSALELAWQGLIDMAWGAGESVFILQAGLVESMDPAAWLGLVALGLSAMLSMSVLMPQDSEGWK